MLLAILFLFLSCHCKTTRETEKEDGRIILARTALLIVSIGQRPFRPGLHPPRGLPESFCVLQRYISRDGDAMNRKASAARVFDVSDKTRACFRARGSVAVLGRCTCIKSLCFQPFRCILSEYRIKYFDDTKEFGN